MAEHIAKLTLSFFAEFLKPPSPVCLSLLDSLTCVGLRYGQNTHSCINFSRRLTSASSSSKLELYSHLPLSCDKTWYLNPHIEGLA